MRVLAVAESDAFVKWSAWTLEHLPDDWQVDLVTIRSAISPTVAQTRAALSGTRWAGEPIEEVGAVGLLGRLRRSGPDAVLLACTGPTVAAISLVMAVARRRVVLVSGIPGIALPVRRRAIDARRLVDVFVTHSHRERAEFDRAFSGAGSPTTVALTTLPFLDELRDRARTPTTGERLVFASQPSVPASERDRTELLQRLSRLGPPTPAVKLRTVAGEGRLTHHEPYPYTELWDELVASGAVDAGALEFVDGPMSTSLERASGLVTVSSTAALEAVALGIPTLVIDDFGVSEELLNSVFEGSGLLGSLADGVPSHPDRSWARMNYLHPPGENDLASALEDAERARVPVRRVVHVGYLKAAVRGFLRTLGRRRR